METFRSIPPYNLMTGSQPRQTTSNVGLLQKASFEAKVRGLNKIFYAMPMSSRTVEPNEVAMLSNLHKP